MASSYPGALDTLTNPLTTDPLSSPSHAAQHTNANDAIEAIEGELGTDPAGSHATVKARLDTVEGDASWTAPTFQNSWVNFGGTLGTAGYRKANGIVYLRGIIKSGTINTVAFNLPAGYRPAADTRFPSVSNSAFGSCIVDTSGNVTPQVGNNASFSLDGILFFTS